MRPTTRRLARSTTAIALRPASATKRRRRSVETARPVGWTPRTPWTRGEGSRETWPTIRPVEAWISSTVSSLEFEGVDGVPHAEHEARPAAADDPAPRRARTDLGARLRDRREPRREGVRHVVAVDRERLRREGLAQSRDPPALDLDPLLRLPARVGEGRKGEAALVEAGIAGRPHGRVGELADVRDEYPGFRRGSGRTDSVPSGSRRRAAATRRRAPPGGNSRRRRSRGTGRRG